MPICSRPIYYHRVAEDASPGTLLLRVSADDPDVVSSSQFYLSGKGAGRFAMDASSGQLSIQKPLDREKQSRYNLRVTARDGGHPSWQCFCFITIEVGDVNDNPPIFSQKSYSVNVPENLPENLLLMKISATDPDLGICKFNTRISSIYFSFFGKIYNDLPSLNSIFFQELTAKLLTLWKEAANSPSTEIPEL